MKEMVACSTSLAVEEQFTRILSVIVVILVQ